ncbi:MAG TPA: oligosaccharide flippase family protein [Bryobacteraceae bacterium]|nr:oligosaccharide flippase family protein [Bryobacteraceae bacterium]
MKGTIWTVLAYAGGMGLRLVSNIILTHILAPQLFGLMTLLATAVTGLTLFSDLGLTPNIVRSSRGDDPQFLNTAWTMQVIRGAALWTCCLIVAVPFARFYGEPQLRVMVPVIGLSLLISGFNSTSLSTFARRIAVRELAFLDLSIQAVQLIFTVGWALVSRSVWALIAGRLLADVARLTVSHFLIKGQRTSFRWDREAARELFAFGRWVVLSTALTFLASQSDRMILGKLVSLRTLGLYGIAFTLADIPRQIILSFCTNIVFPFVSRLAHLPRAEFFAHVLKHRRHVLIAASAILAFVITFGDQFMVHIYDSRYHQASWMVPILALGLWHTLLYATTNACLFAVGKPQYVVAGYFFSALVVLGVTPFAFHQWGLLGFVWTVAFSDVPMYFVNLFGLGREGMYPALQDARATLLFLLLCGLLVAARVAFGLHFPQPVALH